MDVQAISSVLGWLSIGCWIIVYTPQIHENYQLKSGEGLSVAFVVIWLIGDLTNLAGAILAHLLLTVVLLAIYYTLCDAVLLFQIFYYRRTHPIHIEARPHSPSPASLEQTETTPLLAQTSKDEEEQPLYRQVLSHAWPYLLGITFVCSIGAISYWVNVRKSHQGLPEKRDDIFEWKSQLFGWISAILYLGSRIPQILKNVTTKCAGLSPVLFFFAIAGNVTYVASILVISTDGKYLAVNAPWLAGSGLTVFLDIIVLSQFIYYRTAQVVLVPEES
ncbi:hypothetical protein M422DRAFT_24519 [Sphaerobolus stellatus SS14]|nr:hypothetical protein M422DRAFT_24519 [Sphaerobolus stellatus SS14]